MPHGLKAFFALLLALNLAASDDINGLYQDVNGDEAVASEVDGGRLGGGEIDFEELLGDLNLLNNNNEEDQEQVSKGFPALNSVQRSFAVNPDFRSFYDPSYRKEEGIDSPTDEVVEDPVVAASSHFNPGDKKASADWTALLRGVSTHELDQIRTDDMYFTAVVAVSSALAVFGIVGAGFCYHRIRRNSKASEDVEYPAYGVTGPGGPDKHSPTSGSADRKLAQNAQMYHYQHQKQQMIAFDSASNGSEGKRAANANGLRVSGSSDLESDDGDEEEEADYTVYECPGLAPAGEMEVHNPLFQDDTTPKAANK